MVVRGGGPLVFLGPWWWLLVVVVNFRWWWSMVGDGGGGAVKALRGPGRRSFLKGPWEEGGDS